MDFFNTSDLELLSNVKEKRYNPTNSQDLELVSELKNKVWEKTQYWQNEVLKNLSGFSGICRKIWFNRDWSDGTRALKFKHYTWSKIYIDGDEGRDVFFTLGASGKEKALVYKLDFQFDKSSNLTDMQKNICYEIQKANPESWQQIELQNLKYFNWGLLIKATVDFIKKNKDLYNYIITKVWEINEKRVSRITWNGLGWVRPSGPYGKSKNKECHEYKHGYGHEEWLLDTGKVIDGYHYGFLEPVRKAQETYESKIFDVWLYTINSETKIRYWIGEIYNLEVINETTADEIRKIYKDKGWLNEMELQIKDSGANVEGFSNWKAIQLFNIRFKPNEIKFNYPYYELPRDHPVYKPCHYTLIHFTNDFIIKEFKDKDNFEFTPLLDESNNVDDSPEKQTHNRNPISVEIIYMHKLISKKLDKLLKQKYGEDKVRSEYSTGYGSNKIDIVVNHNEDIIFYEIKIYNCLRTAIREALGQIVEYCFWTNQQRAKKLIIVTQPHIEIEDAKEYIKHLRNMTGLNIHLQTFDLEQNILSEEF